MSKKFVKPPSFTSRKGAGTTPAAVIRSMRLVFFAVLTLGTPVSSWAAPADEALRALALIPKFDFSRLSDSAKRELATVLSDEFDYCGRPLTLMATLRKDDACSHTKRLVALAAAMAAEGSAASDIVVALGRYHQGFTGKRHAFKTNAAMCLGPADAKVTLVEFADYTCPHCAAARPILENIVKAKKDVRLCFMAFPLSNTGESTAAVKAAFFAREKGKFWPMHDFIFEHQLSLSDKVLKDHGARLGLDAAGLSKALVGETYNEEIEASRQAGRSAGVESTPTVFINGRKLGLSTVTENLSTAIDDELEWLVNNQSWNRR